MNTYITFSKYRDEVEEAKVKKVSHVSKILDAYKSISGKIEQGSGTHFGHGPFKTAGTTYKKDGNLITVLSNVEIPDEAITVMATMLKKQFPGDDIKVTNDKIVVRHATKY